MRIAVTSDRPRLTSLWSTCFGDPADLVDGFWANLWPNITVFVNDDITSMVTAMPLFWQEKRAAYLYAVATEPAARGRGYCRRLMTEVENYLQQQGFSYTLLSPAKPELFSFYRDLGYTTCFFCDQKSYRISDTALPVIPISPVQYASFRLSHLPQAVQYPTYLLEWQASMGQLLKIGTDDCAVIEKTPLGFTVKELLATDPQTAASSLCHYLQADCLTARLPGQQPFGMAKSLDDSLLSPSYLGLAFE